jgi:hypothetical protein
MKNIKVNDIIRVNGKAKDLDAIDELIIDNMLYEALEKSDVYDAFQVEKEREKIKFRLKKMGKDRFVKLDKNIDIAEFDVQVYITNEEIDKAVLTQNLIQMLSLVPEGRMEIAKQVMDIMGLDGSVLPEQQAIPQPNQASRTPVGTEQQITTDANIPVLATNSNI